MDRVMAAKHLLMYGRRELAEGETLMAVEGDGKKQRARRERGQNMIDRVDWWMARALHELRSHQS